MNLNEAVVYDIETYPNCFLLSMKGMFSDVRGTWEMSDFKDDRRELMVWFDHLSRYQIPMIGFNNLHFDYRVIDYIFKNSGETVRTYYDFAMTIINSQDRFGGMIWADQRFAPQIDVFKIHHFDNKAKSTNLKALQINMRSPNVRDLPIPVGTVLTERQITDFLIPYNRHDVNETETFALHSMEALNFRISLIPQFGPDVMNWSDTKIGAMMMEQKIGKEICYDFSSGRKQKRQTPRTRIALNDIIFPYVQFTAPEFNHVLSYLKSLVLSTPDIQQFSEELPVFKTKGIFTNLKARVGGLDYYFGTGGIHGSVSSQRIIATDNWLIRDIDVASLYPSIAIQNNLAPAHLGEHFTRSYASLPQERKKWQELKGKKCVEANSLKLAANSVYGNSNNPYSVFYDPLYTLSTTINGQLLLCMLAERLMSVPTLQIIQINTDGISYTIRADYEPMAAEKCREWEQITRLKLEDQNYKRMFIRDVNNYVAEDFKGGLKTKGAYWTPDPLDYFGSISNAQPPAWHKDLGNVVSIRAAVAAMVHGVPPEQFIRLTTNPYDFCCRIKVKRSDRLVWGNEEVQRNTRYYISHAGKPLTKIAPPSGAEGSFKKANGVSDAEYNRVMTETGGQWDARVCTKNRSVHAARITGIEAGFKVKICNDIQDFNFDDLNYDWYINEAKKLII